MAYRQIQANKNKITTMATNRFRLSRTLICHPELTTQNSKIEVLAKPNQLQVKQIQLASNFLLTSHQTHST